MMEKLAKMKLGTISGPFLLFILAVSLAWASGDDLYTFIRLFDRIAVTVSDKYVDDLDQKKLIFAGIDGMMEKLDPYSRYLCDSDYYYLIQETQGEYAGIGIELDKAGDSVWVNSVVRNSPASYADIKIGDRLIRIDTIDVVGRSPSDCRKLLRGQEDTAVLLKFWRPLISKVFEIELIRDDIHTETVPCWFIDRHNNGYMRISRFSEGGIFEIKSIISVMIDRGINGLIIDLRDNPGGLLYEAIEVTALFLRNGDKIVETKSRNDIAVHTYKAREDGLFKDGPVVVLINGQTASAAEILAGAIQDNDRGLIIGSASFGKGLVQQIMKFSENSALKLTTAKYYTPSDRCIQKDKEPNGLVKRNDDLEILYYTKSGRPVFGGGGIIPDIYVEPYNYPPLIDDIIMLGYVSDFVARYIKNSEIDENYEIDDDLAEEFIGYLKDKDYVYQNDLYGEFVDFKDQLDHARGQSSLRKPVSTIENILKQNAENEMHSLKPQIKDILYDNIISASLGENAAGRLSRQYIDSGIIKAGEVLKNPDTYSGLLVGY